MTSPNKKETPSAIWNQRGYSTPTRSKIKTKFKLEPTRHWRRRTKREKFLYWPRLSFMQVLCRHRQSRHQTQKATCTIWKQHSLLNLRTDQKSFDVSHEELIRHIDITQQDENTLLTPIDLYQVLCRHGKDVTKQKKATCAIWKQHGYWTPTDQKFWRNSREPTRHWHHPTKTLKFK